VVSGRVSSCAPAAGGAAAGGLQGAGDHDRRQTRTLADRVAQEARVVSQPTSAPGGDPAATAARRAGRRGVLLTDRQPASGRHRTRVAGCGTQGRVRRADRRHRGRCTSTPSSWKR
jgi:hypothetical protein